MKLDEDQQDKGKPSSVDNNADGNSSNSDNASNNHSAHRMDGNESVDDAIQVFELENQQGKKNGNQRNNLTSRNSLGGSTDDRRDNNNSLRNSIGSGSGSGSGSSDEEDRYFKRNSMGNGNDGGNNTNFPRRSPHHRRVTTRTVSFREEPSPKKKNVKRTDSDMSILVRKKSFRRKAKQEGGLTSPRGGSSRSKTPVAREMDAFDMLIYEAQKERSMTEIPRALNIDILGDALPIVEKTYGYYKKELGESHFLSKQAKEHMEKLQAMQQQGYE
eukprot:TRINITY_DN1001_c1_g1_i1.p1 TRINITY_DN1001_c1_g1~~TRINITY_DN1001_c1_g1_i1.p1  ORF type:complete len:273 (-),score=88.51 TRINITY_DN1001_c1_g1_i1:58-876(-)